MSKVGLRTLVLRPDYLPVNMFPLYSIMAEKALVRVLTDTAICCETYNRAVKTPSRDDLFWPSVIVNHRFYRERKKPILSRETLFYRDKGRCAYCHGELTTHNITIDHVIPKDKGGKNGWLNSVAACQRCNAKKDNNDPVGKWKPNNRIYEPTIHELFDARREFPIVIDDEKWLDYIGPWRSKVHIRNHE